MSKEKKMNKKDFWVGRMLLITCSISNKHPCYFQNKHLHFQNILQTWKHFQKINIFVYILTNENHYKGFLDKASFQNIFKTAHKEPFQTIEKQKQVI